MNRTRQPLACADGVNLLGANTKIKKNREIIIIDSSKVVWYISKSTGK
jgi:hypothetical protein